ncbi:MAG: Stk1 family PASTA domain-containing Ser/Thr kinase [Solirubrobacterales bacterium]|nr:Stk1 family PASTA domain-containing Ser/Thr kinase [Solirubrobacterales bacterium]
MDNHRLEDGTIVDGRYRIGRRIGAGGMAEVYVAEDLQLGRKIALKILYGRFAEDEEFVERFRREASAAAGLQHQNVVSIYDRGELDETAYIAMEYVDGRTLKAIVTEEGTLDPKRAIELIVQVLRAARFAHKRGVIHRDFKPQNVIVDAEDRAKVADFGIARAGASDMTQTGSIMGTAQYLSPEQAQGLPVSAQSDLYSIGIMLFELLTGRVPFEGDSAVSIALKQVSETPPRPAVLNPAVTPELEQVIMRALEKEPARRFGDADEFAAALEHAAASLDSGTTSVVPQVPVAPVTGSYGPVTGAYGPVSESYAYPPQPLAPVIEEDGGRRWWIPLLVGLLVAAAVVGGLLLAGGKQVTVPAVTGVQQAEAEAALRNQGFDTDSIQRADPQAAGTVIGQDPRGNSQADEGSTVTLTISSGPGQETVPADLVGLGRRAARKKVTEAGFRAQETERASADVPKGRVIETSPDGGQRLDKGEVVTLIISTGPEDAKVPDVLRQSREEATSNLRDAGFDVTVKTTERDDVDPGTVVRQDPAGGQERAQGTTVTITVAEESKQVDVPDVTGRSQADATRTLSGAGFQVSPQTRDTTVSSEDGQVLSQSPASGQADRGATVTITVGRLQETRTQPDTGGGGSGSGSGSGGSGSGTTGTTGP